jgi:putative FmdB family regulatory protein
MPDYQYQCAACGHRFTARQGMSEPALKKCPECGGLCVD